MRPTFSVSSQARWQYQLPDQDFTWYVRIQGELVEVFRTLNYSRVPQEGTRGVVKGFSAKSRVRLLKVVARIKWNDVRCSRFITLTYPDAKWKVGPKHRSMHRHLFFRYLEKYLGRKVCCMWRTEWKPRESGVDSGKLAPHIHLVVLECPRIPWQTVRSWWRRSIGHRGYVHTYIQRIVGTDGPAKYCCKYMGKPDSLVSSPYLSTDLKNGRAWGLTRPTLAPWHPVDLFKRLSDTEVYEARRYAVENLRHYSTDLGGGFFLLGADEPGDFKRQLLISA